MARTADSAQPRGSRCRSTFLDRLEAGEPVEVHSWELPDQARRGFGVSERVRVESDGSLALVMHEEVGPDIDVARSVGPGLQDC